MSKKQSAVSYSSFPRKRESRKDVVSDKTTGLDSCFCRNDYNFPVFNSSEAGFTLVELLITMVIFVFFIAAASQVFTGLLTQFKQQSKIAETNIEGIIGLEILRQDIEHAGYGLPWNLNGASYSEAGVETATPWVDRDFNDGPPTNPARGTDPGDPASNPPGAIRSGNGYALNSSDVLVIKAINVARNNASEKWTHLFTGNTVTKWNPARERLETSDRVIVLSPGTTRTLVVNGGSFTTRYNANTDPTPDGLMDPAFAPGDNTETRVVYGVTPPANPVTTSLRMPFNRADYYVRRPTTMPQRCAKKIGTDTGTGILYKATVNQADGLLNELPLFDCAADMQVDFWLDTDGDGRINWPPSDNISALTAQQIREQVKEVRVYILAHEGQKDINYDFSMGGTREFLSAIEVLDNNSRTINFVNLKTLIGNPEYKYYRWKVYTIVVKLMNLG
jgi:prepilin-type N-terminal cleavage/methylation domain-containing protein